MKLIRFQKDNTVFQGVLQDEQVFPLEGSYFGDFHIKEKGWPRHEVKLLAPCEPSKIICVGLNYADHAQEMNLVIPEWPVIFMKPFTTVIGPEEEIIYPDHFVKRLDYEGELAVVIKKTGKNIPEAESLDYVLGYTCSNDVTARNIQPKDGQWTVSKSFDTFCPLGPVIVTDLPWNELDISSRLNGVLKQQSNTKNLIFGIPYLIHYLSQVMTLLPGDVIITGTPSGIGAMEIGDEVSVTIEGIGTLTNLVGKAG
ncbi:fumarylacetoacetate hydrolase family protein [Dehalobacterium formicoaceticum]|uniref:fumarylacetoacetate hydrolase family protein n=1 Tax=Dehalobacterium formicoaceticum TaxID=51515 RepID=UPI000B7EF244|nr:fumarylacetoacetate hydrolase family protein [Dehalobacterium formicoaceticum]